mgnify:CR=1 FL=1
MNIYDQLWQKILNDLEQTFSEETFADVFESLKSTHKYANGHVYVLVPSEFIKNRISASNTITTFIQRFVILNFL